MSFISVKFGALLAKLRERRATIESLIEESRADSDFFLFLIFGAFITTIGLIENDAIILIAGMLIAPLLLPVLAFSLGMVTRSFDALDRSLSTMLMSVIVVTFISFVTALILLDGRDVVLSRFTNPSGTFALTAFLSGIIASYAWIKQTTTTSLPSVALTIALIVPLSAIGVSAAMKDQELLYSASILFAENFLLIVLASILVFLLTGFSTERRFVEKVIHEEGKKQ